MGVATAAGGNWELAGNQHDETCAATRCMAAISVKQPSTCTPRDGFCPVQDIGGIPPGLQRFSYAGKNLEDPQRTLEQCVLVATTMLETNYRLETFTWLTIVS